MPANAPTNLMWPPWEAFSVIVRKQKRPAVATVLLNECSSRDALKSGSRQAARTLQSQCHAPRPLVRTPFKQRVIKPPSCRTRENSQEPQRLPTTDLASRRNSAGYAWMAWMLYRNSGGSLSRVYAADPLACVFEPLVVQHEAHDLSSTST